MHVFPLISRGELKYEERKLKSWNRVFVRVRKHENRRGCKQLPFDLYFTSFSLLSSLLGYFVTDIFFATQEENR